VSYTELERLNDQEKLAAAFEAIDAIRNQFGDIVKLEVLTIDDVAFCAMHTRDGAKLAKDIYSRAELLYALDVLTDSPCANIEEAVYLAVQDYRQTQTTHSKEERS
jgi:hypothetical protein